MIKRLIYASALVLGVSALGSLRAENLHTQEVTIPFQFHVQNKSLPAGEYRVIQDTGTEIATLVNARTGQKVQVLRPSSLRKEGKAILTFVQDKNGYSLKVS